MSSLKDDRRSVRWSLAVFKTALPAILATSLLVSGLWHQGLGDSKRISRVSAGSLQVGPGGGWRGVVGPDGSVQASAGAQANLATSPCAEAPDFSWLHTRGMWIKDDHNCKVRLEGVTWYGMESLFHVPAGLDFRSYKHILLEIKDLGFNSVRIPLTDRLVAHNLRIHVDGHVAKDQELLGLHPLAVLDRIVAAAQQLHLFVILDNHQSTDRRVAVNPGVGDALWTAKGYPESTWIHDWVKLAKRYDTGHFCGRVACGNEPTVIGFDLRNEPHTAPPGPWTLKAYLTQGSTWGRYPSSLWSASTDWPSAATRCANAILAINPHILMIVEGVQLYPDRTQPGGVDQYWWGSILRGVRNDPVRLSVPHQLVYSTHEWGPWKYRSRQFFGRVSYKSLSRLFNRQWGFILHRKDHALRAPIWLGEFNTCVAGRWCVKGKHRGSQGQWFSILMRYLRRNPEIGWSYFPINGTNSFDQTSNNGILKRYWRRVKLPAIMSSLRTIQSQPTQ